MTSHVIAYRSLELLFGTHTFHFNCFLEDFNCVFTQIRCLSRVLESALFAKKKFWIFKTCYHLIYLWTISSLLYPPQTLFVGGILFSRCPSVRPSVRPSVTLCFLNNSKSHCWIFIKPCKHVHICKTNTLDKKVRARG